MSRWLHRALASVRLVTRSGDGYLPAARQEDHGLPKNFQIPCNDPAEGAFPWVSTSPSRGCDSEGRVAINTTSSPPQWHGGRFTQGEQIMRRIKLWAAAAVFGLSFLSQAFGQTTGDRVVVVVKETDLKNEAAVVKTIYRATYLTVREVNGNRLWVNFDGTRGWLQRDHVILASRAIEHFTTELRHNPKDTTAMCARAIAWDHKCEVTNAIRDCTDAITINSECAWA